MFGAIPHPAQRAWVARKFWIAPWCRSRDRCIGPVDILGVDAGQLEQFSFMIRIKVKALTTRTGL